MMQTCKLTNSNFDIEFHISQPTNPPLCVGGYRVAFDQFPSGGTTFTGRISGNTHAEYYLSKIQQTNLVLIVMDNWGQASASMSCGVLSTRCPNVILPRSDVFTTTSVCDPPASYYKKSVASLVDGGVVTTPIVGLGLIVGDMCIPDDNSISSALLVSVLGGVVAGVGGFNLIPETPPPLII